MLTILMPCYNEEANIGYCIDQAMAYIQSKGLEGEILVVDNGSTDSSVAVAKSHGARVVTERFRGYGSALRAGLSEAKGDVIIIGDADSTYDFSDLDPFYLPIATDEADMVIGDRFTGLMEKGSMPVTHRLGVPFLSWCSRVKFKTRVHDFHCGIRSISKVALDKCSFHTTGMEFATEMIAEVCRKGLRIKEVPVSLRVARKDRKTKLRTIPDGLRHLKYIFFS